MKGCTSSTPTHNTFGLGALTPVSPSVITLLAEACWCVSLPRRRQHSCVWYSVGGIRCSALKFMDQVQWLPSTAVCYNIVALPPLNMSAVFSSQLLRLRASVLAVSGLLKMRPALNAKLTRLFCSPPPSPGIRRGIWNTHVFLFVSHHRWAVFTTDPRWVTT